MSETLHQRYGLKEIVNAWGKASKYGTSRSPQEVARATGEALSHFFDMAELEALVGEKIAELTGAEAGCLTHCTAAAITLAAAAAMTGADRGKVAQLPDTGGMAHKIAIQMAHCVNFGAPITQMLRLSGAEVVVVGSANRCHEYELLHALAQPDVAAVFAVESRLSIQHGALPLARVVELAHAHGVPVLVDGAAQDQRLPEILEQGADVVLAGAQKYLGGPTAGIIAGERSLVEAIALQHQGIGRSMKPSKEAMFGTLAAIQLRQEQDRAALREQHRQALEYARQSLSAIPGIAVTFVPAPTGNPFSLVRLDFDEAVWKVPLPALVRDFARRDPVIALAPHFAPSGYLLLELHELRRPEIDALAAAFREVLATPSS